MTNEQDFSGPVVHRPSHFGDENEDRLAVLS